MSKRKECVIYMVWKVKNVSVTFDAGSSPEIFSNDTKILLIAVFYATHAVCVSI